MSLPIPVDILSDSDQEPCDNPSLGLTNDAIDLVTPPQFKKKRKTEAFLNPCSSTVLIIDDDPTPCKEDKSSSGHTPSFVAETPFSDASIVGCSQGKCLSSGSDFKELIVADTPISEHLKSGVFTTKYRAGVSNCEPSCSLVSSPSPSPAKINGWIRVESDNEFDDIGQQEDQKFNECEFDNKLMDELEYGTRFAKKLMEDFGSVSACSHSDDKTHELNPGDHNLKQQDDTGYYLKENKKADGTVKPNRKSKDERIRLMEEKKQLKEQEKLLKAASKAQAAEMKRCKREMQKWEKGKFALKSIVAEIDKKVIELGSIGGYLLTRFAEKGLTYRVTSNPIERTIIWRMVVPEEILVIASERLEISYVLIVYEAEEFCNLAMSNSLMDHVHSVQHQYPHHTICYVTNRLMAYINKREQAQYKKPGDYAGWKRPAIEEVLSNLATHFFNVHSRQCVDEAEIAEHVVGLTCSLASCQFRKKLTRLSVNSNGLVIPKDCADKNLIKKNLWLKALVAIPKVQPRCAISIWKRYPTMKSLLSVYMDPTKSVHEKEFLLKDLMTGGLVSDDRRRVGEVCSKRIYRILMAQSGNIKTDDVEDGADFFN